MRCDQTESKSSKSSRDKKKRRKSWRRQVCTKMRSKGLRYRVRLRQSWRVGQKVWPSGQTLLGGLPLKRVGLQRPMRRHRYQFQRYRHCNLALAGCVSECSCCRHVSLKTGSMAYWPIRGAHGAVSPPYFRHSPVPANRGPFLVQ